MSGFAAGQSKLLGAGAVRLVRATGGSCRTAAGLTVCRCGRVRLYARGGTQFGDTFVSGKDAASLSEGLLAHEKYHRDAQWRRYGWWFAVMYLYAELADVWLGGRAYNRYELAAELATDFGGGYPRPE